LERRSGFPSVIYSDIILRHYGIVGIVGLLSTSLVVTIEQSGIEIIESPIAKIGTFELQAGTSSERTGYRSSTSGVE
jgi:hypothetical protein